LAALPASPFSFAAKRVWAQFRLEETGGGLRAPGDSVLLSCRGSGFSFGNYGFQWYRQAPGGTLEWVSFIGIFSTFTDYAAAVEGRATVSRDNSRSVASLFMRALQPQDSARYFCAVHTETGNPAELLRNPAAPGPS
uniref:Ig-like domain-containing protein n=1 Tax=Strigops habroptila TaxID=2489341 RepID=A0A672UYX9_STRHB